jgi:hypothetical protein
MSISFKEVDHAKKNLNSIHLTATIEAKYDFLVVTGEDRQFVVQAEKYSEVGQAIEDAVRMIFEDESILFVKTAIITETFVVIEIALDVA